jgi:hypothetical protein
VPSGNETGEVVIQVSNEQTSLRLPLVNSDRTEVYRVRAISSTNVPSAFSGQAVANRIGWERADLPTDGPGGRGTDGIE